MILGGIVTVIIKTCYNRNSITPTRIKPALSKIRHKCYIGLALDKLEFNANSLIKCAYFPEIDPARKITNSMLKFNKLSQSI